MGEDLVERSFTDIMDPYKPKVGMMGGGGGKSLRRSSFHSRVWMELGLNQRPDCKAQDFNSHTALPPFRAPAGLRYPQLESGNWKGTSLCLDADTEHDH